MLPRKFCLDRAASSDIIWIAARHAEGLQRCLLAKQCLVGLKTTLPAQLADRRRRIWSNGGEKPWLPAALNTACSLRHPLQRRAKKPRGQSTAAAMIPHANVALQAFQRPGSGLLSWGGAVSWAATMTSAARAALQGEAAPSRLLEWGLETLHGWV